MNRAWQSYQKTTLQTSSSLETIILLYEKCLGHLAKLRAAISSGQIAEKSLYLRKAMDIVIALDGNLDFEQEEIAAQLHDSYQCILAQLSQANIRNDSAPVELAEKWLADLLATWKQLPDNESLPK